MAIEGVAGQHHDVRAGRAGGAQDAGEPGGPITPVQACGIVVIDVQVGAVNDYLSLVAAPAWGMAAEHNRPALLGNASASPSQARGDRFCAGRGPAAGPRFARSCEAAPAP